MERLQRNARRHTRILHTVDHHLFHTLPILDLQSAEPEEHRQTRNLYRHLGFESAQHHYPASPAHQLDRTRHGPSVH